MRNVQEQCLIGKLRMWAYRRFKNYLFIWFNLELAIEKQSYMYIRLLILSDYYVPNIIGNLFGITMHF